MRARDLAGTYPFASAALASAEVHGCLLDQGDDGVAGGGMCDRHASTRRPQDLVDLFGPPSVSRTAASHCRLAPSRPVRLRFAAT